jgi:hypothetical protein
MKTYQFNPVMPPNTAVNSCNVVDGGICFPLDPDNSDYQQFLVDWEAGAEVLNHDGTPAPYVAAIQELTTRLAALKAK